MQRHIDDQVMHKHIGKHLIHLVFKAMDFEVSMVTFMALILGSIALLEAGLWVIHRREAVAESR